MQPNALSRGTGVMPRNWSAPHAQPIMARFLGKLVLDEVPQTLRRRVRAATKRIHRLHATVEVAPAFGDVIV